MCILWHPRKRHLLCSVGLAIMSAAVTHAQSSRTADSAARHKQAQSIAQRRKQTALHTAWNKKIELDLSYVTADGLRGPADGKVSLPYEVCIPDTRRCRNEVKRIDSGVQFMPGVSGHIGAHKGQALCLSSTHQSNWRTVLQHLVVLPYISRIIENVFE